MRTLIKADELAKDISGAEALLTRHRERKVCVCVREGDIRLCIG